MSEPLTLLSLDEEIPFAMISKPLIHSRGLFHSYEKLILVSLFSYAQQGSTAFPSLNTLAAELGTSKPTVIKHLKTLEEKNILQKEKRFSSRGDNTSNLYTLSRRNLITFLNQEVVKEVYHPSKGGLPLVVKEVYHPSKGGLPLVVKEVYPNNKYKEREIVKRKIKEEEKVSVNHLLASPTLFGRVKSRLSGVEETLKQQGFDEKEIQNWSKKLLEKHVRVDSSGHNSLHTLDLNWIGKNLKHWDSLKESLELFLASHKKKWYPCTNCGKLRSGELNNHCPECLNQRNTKLKEQYTLYSQEKRKLLEEENFNHWKQEYQSFLANPLIKLQLERVQEEKTRRTSFFQSKGLFLSWEEWQAQQS